MEIQSFGELPAAEDEDDQPSYKDKGEIPYTIFFQLCDGNVEGLQPEGDDLLERQQILNAKFLKWPTLAIDRTERVRMAPRPPADELPIRFYYDLEHQLAVFDHGKVMVLSAPFLRRCIVYYNDFPNTEHVLIVPKITDGRLDEYYIVGGTATVSSLT